MKTVIAFPKDGSMDEIVVSLDDIAEDYTTEIPTSIYDVWDEEKKEWVFSIEKKAEFIGKHIYHFYSRDKQSQDRGYQAYAQTVIIGTTANSKDPVSTDGLTVEIMGAVLKIDAGEITLNDFVSSKPEPLQEYYEKLVKIGLRLKWAKNCVDEGKLAIVENRDPSYPIFPTFGGA